MKTVNCCGWVVRNLMLGVFAVVAGTAHAATWYQKAHNNTGYSDALTNLSYWVQNGTAGTGRPTADDDLIAYNGWRLRIAGLSCPAKSLQVGEGTTKCEVVQDSGTAAFSNDGLKLVKGGWWLNASSDLGISGPMTVLSPNTAPFGIFWGQDQYSNRTAVVSSAISGASESGLIWGYTSGWSACARNSTFNLKGDLSGFEGTFYVRAKSADQMLDGDNYGSRLLLPTTTSPCTINVEKGCVIGAISPQTTTTVARLNFSAGTRYEPQVTTYWNVSDTSKQTVSCLKVTDALTLAAPVEIYWNHILRGTGQFRLPILMAPASSTFTADDFTLVKGSDFYNLDLHFEVGTDPATGMRTLYAVTWGFVYQMSRYDSEGTRDLNATNNVSSLTNAAAWWDGLVPHAGSAYRLSRMSLRTLLTPTEDYVFPGVSLWLQNGATLLPQVKSFSVPTLYTSGGATIFLPMGVFNNPVTVKADRFNFEGAVTLRAHAGHALVLKGPIDGGASIAMQGSQPTGGPQAFYELEGVNTNFTGTIAVTMDEYRAQYVSFDSQFPTLYVNDGRNLGGRRAAFTPRALKLTHMARLSVTNDSTVTLASDLNRGIYVLEKGRLHAKNATTVLDVRQPILLSGHLWTEGNGTVVLGGAMSFEATDGGTIVEVPRDGSNLVTVVSKTLKAAHPDCLNGCDVTFNAGTKLVLDADALGSTGLKLTRSGSAVHLDDSFNGKLPVTVTTTQAEPANPARSTLIGLVTVPDGDGVAAVRALMPTIPRIWPNIAQNVVELHDETNSWTTFALNVQNQGTLILFR